jgi:hypothetical protein
VDGKILLDDDKPEQAQTETAESGTPTKVAVPDEAVEFPPITLDDDGPEAPWVM